MKTTEEMRAIWREQFEQSVGLFRPEAQALLDDLDEMIAAVVNYCNGCDTAEHKVALANVSGALVDAGSVAVPDDPMQYGVAVRALTAERDKLHAERDRLREGLLQIQTHYDPDKPGHKIAKQALEVKP